MRVNTLFSSAPASVGRDQLNLRWDCLPQPVRRYLRYAVPAGAPAIRTARLKHDGFLRTAPGSRWFRVVGEEYFTVANPGFVWKASIRPGSLVWIEALDRLIANRGEVLVNLYSTITLGRSSGD